MSPTITAAWLKAARPSVTATNDAADAVDDTGSATEGAGAVSFDVLANDSHPDGDSFTLTNVEVTEGNGSVSIVNGEVVFNPDVSHNELADGETADVTVSYTIEDADGEESTAELTITVTGTNDAPDVSLTGSSVDENAVGGTIVGDLAAIDPDNGDSHTYAVDDASSPFEVVDGQLVVKDGAELNYEDNSAVDVDVTVTTPKALARPRPLPLTSTICPPAPRPSPSQPMVVSVHHSAAVNRWVIGKRTTPTAVSKITMRTTSTPALMTVAVR